MEFLSSGEEGILIGTTDRGPFREVKDTGQAAPQACGTKWLFSTWERTRSSLLSQRQPGCREAVRVPVMETAPGLALRRSGEGLAAPHRGREAWFCVSVFVFRRETPVVGGG